MPLRLPQPLTFFLACDDRKSSGGPEHSVKALKEKLMYIFLSMFIQMFMWNSIIMFIVLICKNYVYNEILNLHI